ncbi:hypothetical protein CSOJ01_02955 [Colletotrichum sojae]|uniref:Uncharacterized protein n=1 Tax=Colletotrichum sojae TaxID=2175907 RepID=A0A8H6N1Y5_9PEZI|nr:hypothetical protein CSOJ01_02955 [Colletotrichum sojae]
METDIKSGGGDRGLGLSGRQAEGCHRPRRLHTHPRRRSGIEEETARQMRDNGNQESARDEDEDYEFPNRDGEAS